VYLYTAGAFTALLGIMCVPGLVSFSIRAEVETKAKVDAPLAAASLDKSDFTASAAAAADAAAVVNANAAVNGGGVAIGGSARSVVAVAFSQPSCCAATAVAALSYSAMSFLMSPTPLAMRADGFSFTQVGSCATVH
jgi:hypothetical protein